MLITWPATIPPCSFLSDEWQTGSGAPELVCTGQTCCSNSKLERGEECWEPNCITVALHEGEQWCSECCCRNRMFSPYLNSGQLIAYSLPSYPLLLPVLLFVSCWLCNLAELITTSLFSLYWCLCAQDFCLVCSNRGTNWRECLIGFKCFSINCEQN